MSLDTNLNTSPFFDDFDELKNYHQILFRPSVPVQARELNQLQTILQNQIERFGNQIFKDGTILTGCTFTFDSQYHYIKLFDLQIDGEPTNVDLYGNTILKSTSSNLQALVINSRAGLETQDPDLSTVYIKYLNSGNAGEKTFANNEVVTVYGRDADGAANTSNQIAQIKVANSTYTDPVGLGYAMTVADGYIYQKGYFVRVDNQTVIVDAYSQTPNNISVGFTTAESIIDENTDTSLLDNASGFTNENAPGALRMKLVPTLVAVNTDSAPNTFFALVQFEHGQPTKQRDTTEYSGIGREMAKRTMDESGNYVIRPFTVTSSTIPGNTTHISVDTGAGAAYIDGYNVEQFNTRSIPARKGTTTRSANNQSVTTNFGNYALVSESLGYFAFNVSGVVNLRDTAAARLTAETYTIPTPGNVIGTAKIRSVVYESGVPGTPSAQYRLYLFDVRMNAGKNFSNVKSIQSSTGIADIVQEANTSYLYETDFNTLIFPFGQKALKTLLDGGGNTDTSFTYRTQTSGASFNANGVLTITLPSGYEFPYTAGANLNDTQEEDIIVVMGQTIASANLTGTVAITSGSNVATGSGTSFVSTFAVGDYFAAVGDSTTARRVTAVINNTSLVVSSNFGTTNASGAYVRAFPNNTPVKLAGIGGASMNVDGTGQVLTISLGGNLSGAANAVVTYDAVRNTAIQLNKTITKNIYVKLDLSTNPNSNTGPWVLGLPDVKDIVAVYKHTSFTGIEDSSHDVTSKFHLNSGQNENKYGLATLRKVAGSTLSITTSDKLLVVLEVFQSDASGGGKGYYSVDSYPVDDATVPEPVDKIRTEEIPIYTTTTGVSYDLRNCIDFRPYVANTAAYSNTAAGATTNPSSTETYAATEKYFPTPNKTMVTDLQYYLGRIDAVVMDSFGNLLMVEGIPSENPVAPNKIDGAMLLAYATIPPYPTLSVPDASAVGRPDYAAKFKLSQNRRYTMQDIGGLDKRINNLEYYTSLSLLEKATTDLVIPSSVDGSLNRFKNGILVDPFNDFTISNLSSPEFKAGINPSASELIPSFIQNKFDMEVTAYSNCVATGDGVTLTYSSSPAWVQPYASRVRNLTEQFYLYNGKAEIFPPYDNYYETRTSPQIISIDTAQQTLDLVDNLNDILPLNRTTTASTSTTTQQTNTQIKLLKM